MSDVQGNGYFLEYNVTSSVTNLSRSKSPKLKFGGKSKVTQILESSDLPPQMGPLRDVARTKKGPDSCCEN